MNNQQANKDVCLTSFDIEKAWEEIVKERSDDYYFEDAFCDDFYGLSSITFSPGGAPVFKTCEEEEEEGIIRKRALESRDKNV